jgi:hypothetical protein
MCIAEYNIYVHERQQNLQSQARRPSTLQCATCLESACMTTSLASIASFTLEPSDESLERKLGG